MLSVLFSGDISDNLAITARLLSKIECGPFKSRTVRTACMNLSSDGLVWIFLSLLLSPTVQRPAAPAVTGQLLHRVLRVTSWHQEIPHADAAAGQRDSGLLHLHGTAQRNKTEQKIFRVFFFGCDTASGEIASECI